MAYLFLNTYIVSTMTQNIVNNPSNRRILDFFSGIEGVLDNRWATLAANSLSYITSFTFFNHNLWSIGYKVGGYNCDPLLQSIPIRGFEMDL